MATKIAEADYRLEKRIKMLAVVFKVFKQGLLKLTKLALLLISLAVLFYAKACMLLLLLKTFLPLTVVGIGTDMVKYSMSACSFVGSPSQHLISYQHLGHNFKMSSPQNVVCIPQHACFCFMVKWNPS